MSNSAEMDEVRVPPVISEAAPAERKPRSRKVAVRIWSIFFLGICGSILVLGAMMTPSEKGYGTHTESLKLPPCGMLQMTGYPCPTCGCTTAVTHLMHGSLWMSVKTQPFGAAVGAICVVLVIVSIFGLIKGRWLWPDPMKLSMNWPKIAIWSTVFFCAAWGYKALAIKMGW